jgi:hypothetical protein
VACFYMNLTGGPNTLAKVLLTGCAFTVGNSLPENLVKRFQLTVTELKKLRGRVVEFLQ